MQNDLYALYLRKSRKDMESERLGIDTLERHESMLNAFAKANNIKIGKIYREVVSGDSIAARPQMQQLLSDVENGLWAGVLVVEVERLARGDTIDQGIIAQTFKYSDTKILTPYKTYDPNDEFDEEFFEYGLFQSRREYKAITRRQQRGINKSVEDGKWPYNKAPYGYERYKLSNQKGFSLKIIPEEAKIVKYIFNTYANENVGYGRIAEQLNEMNIPGPVDTWHYSTIKDILVNPAYIGKVKRGRRACVKKVINGEVVTSRPRSSNYKLCDGLHEAIIDESLFNTVQEKFSHHPSKPVAGALEIKNPLAGLVYCQKCGHKMIRRPQDRCRTLIICPVKGCDNISSYESEMEKYVLKYLADYLEEIKLEEQTHTPNTAALDILQNSLNSFNKELITLNEQLDNAYNLVERGIYTPEVFLKRSESINNMIKDTTDKKNDIEKRIDRENKKLNKRNILIPKIENALDVYDSVDIPERNALLTGIIERIDYIKTEHSKRNGPYDNFQMTIHPRIPL